MISYYGGAGASASERVVVVAVGEVSAVAWLKSEANGLLRLEVDRAINSLTIIGAADNVVELAETTISSLVLDSLPVARCEAEAVFESVASRHVVPHQDELSALGAISLIFSLVPLCVPRLLAQVLLGPGLVFAVVVAWERRLHGSTAFPAGGGSSIVVVNVDLATLAPDCDRPVLREIRAGEVELDMEGFGFSSFELGYRELRRAATEGPVDSIRARSDRAVLCHETLALVGETASIPGVEGDEYLLSDLRSDSDLVGSAAFAAPGH